MLVIAPSHELHDPSLMALFTRDMRHLEAVADGNVAGACGFYQTMGTGANDGSCAQAIGLTGKRAAIERSLADATLLSYNGFTQAQNSINGQSIVWILDRGHFRFVQSNIAG
jgi:hypothetical protein